LAKDASDAKVATAVDVGHGEGCSSLEGVGEVVESRLVESALELCRIGEEVEDAWGEVTSQARSALGLADVDLEVGACKGTVLDAAAAGTAEGSKAKDVLARGEFDVVTVATEAGCWREDLGLEGCCRVAVFRDGVEGPVPVAG
jgi:hypothetical protein